jgi:hypothetical protein
MQLRRIALTVTAAALTAALGTPAAAHADMPAPAPVPATPGASILGVGHFTYAEPGVDGHRIRFSIHAWVNADGTTRGVFGYRHLLPDGSELAAGHAEVTCLHTQDGVALVAAVVPEGQGVLVNHGFYVKIVDGGRGRPDRIETLQASGGADRPPRFCVDTAEVPSLIRYPITRGGFRLATRQPRAT